MKPKAIELVISGLAGGIMVWLAYVYLRGPLLDDVFPTESTSFLTFTLIVVASILAAISVHEVGHLVTGLTLGFRFYLFVVACLGVKRDESGEIHAFFNQDLGLAGGVTATFPVREDPRNTKKFAIVLLAGPVTSLSYAIACFALLPILPLALRPFVGISGFLSLLLFFGTTIPQRSGSFFTDRARFQRLMKGGRESETESAILAVLTRALVAGSYKDVDRARIEVIATDPDPFFQFLGRYYAFLNSKEHGDVATCRRLLVELRERKAHAPPLLYRSIEREEMQHEQGARA